MAQSSWWWWNSTPIFIEDFGYGSTNHGPGLPVDESNYLFSEADYPPEGYYTIVKKTMVPNVWRTIEDVNWWWSTKTHGYFMAVHSLKNDTSYFYKKRIALCPSSQYLVGFANCILNTKSDTIHFKINIENDNGDVLLSAPIDNVTTNKWSWGGPYFTTPSNTNYVTVKLYYLGSESSNGLDFAIDYISIFKIGNEIRVVANDGDTTLQLCPGYSTSYNFTGILQSGVNYSNYQWQILTDTSSNWVDIPGATDLNYILNPGLPKGTYLFRLTAGDDISNLICRESSNNIEVQVLGPQIVASSPNCIGESLEMSIKGVPIDGYSFVWTGPNNFYSTDPSPEIASINNAEMGTYYLSATGVCSGVDSLIVHPNPLPTINAGADQTICEGDSVMLNGETNGAVHFWSPSTNISNNYLLNAFASPTTTTNYILFAYDSNLCTNIDTVTINVIKKPIANAGPDKFMIQGTTVTLEGTIDGNEANYEWIPNYNISATNILNPEVSPEYDTNYILITNSTCGSDTDSVSVKVYKDLSIPNVFSPNGDGINDTWHILQLGDYPNATVDVFNRYGQVVFQSKGYSQEWDGKYKGQALPVGTYYYVIDLKTNIKLQYKGWVEILH